MGTYPLVIASDMINDLWYKHAIIYCLDVATFMDGNGDGVGDFRGLSRRLDYLAGLGVTCIWLMPFYKSPNRDNRYDVTDYYGVDPELGDLGDFVDFSERARQYGIRILVDLVVNHTSDQHPWFQSARADPKSPFRDYYLWADRKPESAGQGMVFPGVQDSTWTFDRQAKAWYFHRFFEYQPDLNIANPEVREQIFKIVGFWIELGVSGFRIDAVPFLIELLDEEHSPKGARFDFLDALNDFVSWRGGDAVLLAEANITLDQSKLYFGDDGRRLHMSFNFPVNQALFLALAQKTARPLEDVLRGLPSLTRRSQWAHFLRNHDELDLARLCDGDRQRIMRAFGPAKNMQLFGRGIRRRLASMLKGDRARLELAYSLLFSLPGTPTLFYGEELGMSENLSVPGRDAVRTPMQWSGERNAGFSTAKKLERRPVAKGRFAYGKINVAEQRRHVQSQLNWTERMIRLRKECPEIGEGTMRLIPSDQPDVLVLRYDLWDRTLVVLHNFASAERRVRFGPELGPDALLVDLLSPGELKPDRSERFALTLEPYGYRWLRATGQAAPRSSS